MKKSILLAMVGYICLLSGCSRPIDVRMVGYGTQVSKKEAIYPCNIVHKNYFIGSTTTYLARTVSDVRGHFYETTEYWNKSR